MLHLGISVSLANILLFLFTEVFIVLMTFNATRLAARYVLNWQLHHGKKVPLNSSLSILDFLPYNSDLHPAGSRTKLLLTFCRLAVIAISVYIGAKLDGEIKHDTSKFKVSFATGVAPIAGRMLTNNTGADVASSAKLSCLRIINDHRGILYKGYMAGSEILCKDGLATFSTEVLLEAEIEQGIESNPKGISMKGMNILRGQTQAGVTVSETSVVFKSSAKESEHSSEGSCHIVLLERLDDNQCIFGVRRSPGAGYKTSINLTIKTTCDLEIVEFSRIMSSKPCFMPPGISFLLQVLDSVIVSSKTDTYPDRKADAVVATITVGGLVTAIAAAAIATSLSIILWIALREGGVKSDFTSVKGVAELWGEEKFGSNRISTDDSGLFVALEREGKTPYLGSMDSVSKVDWKDAALLAHKALSFAMSASEESSGDATSDTQSPSASESDDPPDPDDQV